MNCILLLPLLGEYISNCQIASGLKDASLRGEAELRRKWERVERVFARYDKTHTHTIG